MFYQVLIEDKENKKMYELDKDSKETILDEVVVPYLQKQGFQFDGYFLDPEDINRIIIKETEITTKELSKYENDNMPTGLIMYVDRKDILGYDDYTRDITKEMFALGTERVQKKNHPPFQNEESNIDRTKVFIVHGHDKQALAETSLFIRQIGLHPIVLHEQANEGKTIIEKIEAHSNVGFAVVLYTPCDIGAKKEDEPMYQDRARQNVVFEHGFLMGKLGRKNVAALVKGTIETPNDISGVVYINMDEYTRWHVELAKELKQSDYDIDMNRFFS